MAKRKQELPIEWDINEKEFFKEALKDIKKRSEHLAQRIRDRIKENLNLVKQNPYLFEVDSLKTNNDGSFRKFTVLHLKLVYKIDSDKIIIVRVRYSTSEPMEY